jgi:hypothetical protein
MNPSKIVKIAMHEIKTKGSQINMIAADLMGVSLTFFLFIDILLCNASLFGFGIIP